MAYSCDKLVKWQVKKKWKVCLMSSVFNSNWLLWSVYCSCMRDHCGCSATLSTLNGQHWFDIDSLLKIKTVFHLKENMQCIYCDIYWKWDTYDELGKSISLSFLNWNGLNLVSSHIFSRCLDIQNFSFLSLVLSKLWNF